MNLEKDYENDIPKYKKKSNAKGTPRADHKHEYKTAAIKIERIIDGKFMEIIYKGEVCTICGRVGKLQSFWMNKEETKEEVWEKYPHYFMDDFMSKTAIREEADMEPDIICPECFNKAEHKATWDGYLIYDCPHCLSNWKAYKTEEGNIRIIERYFFG